MSLTTPFAIAFRASYSAAADIHRHHYGIGVEHGGFVANLVAVVPVLQVVEIHAVFLREGTHLVLRWDIRIGRMHVFPQATVHFAHDGLPVKASDEVRYVQENLLQFDEK